MTELLPFLDPTVVASGKHQQGRGAMRVKIMGERASASGETKHIPFEVTMCKAIYRILAAHYPGHPWAVEVMADQGVATITIPPLLGANWAYVLHLDKLGSSPQPVIEAGGHILERFHIPRSTIDIAAYVAAEEKVPLIGNFRSSHRSKIPEHMNTNMRRLPSHLIPRMAKAQEAAVART